ncbi:MAG: LexA family transcriptional regulator [Oscillospiraceae bacterium]|nr:LexA family transcriptional regulator [Oscillospiraceae bacterium]
MTLGEIIMKYRAEHHLSQRQFAAQCKNVTNGYISMVEQGRNPASGKPVVPSVEKLTAFAHGMGISLHQLLEMADDMPVSIDKDLPSLPSNVHPISNLHHQRVPLIGSVAAGEPIYDPEDAGVYVESPVEADAAITIRGDSMVPTYLDGDLVYIKARPDVPDGAVAVVFLDDEATLKHVYKRPTGLTLISDNMATHPPLMVEFADYENVRIFGVPVGYTRIYKPGIAGKIRKGFR